MVCLAKQPSLWTGLALVLLTPRASANLTGSGTITYHDYQALPLSAVQNNPPSCGMPYAELDLTRITAVQQMDTATDCGKCIKVTNANNPSLCVYVMAVDTGGRGLDLSKPAFGEILDIDAGVGAAQWEPADSSYCAGIWSNGPQAGSSGGDSTPPAAAEPATSSAPAPTQPATTVVQIASPSSSSSSTAVYVAPPPVVVQPESTAQDLYPSSSAQPEQSVYGAEESSELFGFGHNAEESTSADGSSASDEDASVEESV
ncbi:hypothetical protein LPJ59_000104 [Coemansia sp. RSA 2399]|nr:hypothetical protein LPJ59_000104 [Coemansia sp. RSA 2399]KAJ1908371.1 hypothetical protein LPJ81_000162 [Coemansia sp. IMI 209127]